LPEKCFEAEHLAKPLPFGPIFKAPLFNRGKDGTRSRAAVGAQHVLKAGLKRPALDYIALT